MFAVEEAHWWYRGRRALVRDALLTMGDVLASDLRFKAQDRSDYLAYLLAQGKRLLVVSTTNAAVDQALAQIALEADAREAIERGELVRLGRTEAETQ